MKQRSEEFKNQIKLLGREIDSKITYTIDEEEIELGPEELNSITPSFKGTLLKSVMKELEIDSNIEIPLGTILEYQFGLKVNGEYEYISFGNYVVNKVEKQEDTESWIITCYDKMLYSMVDYESLEITYPITIRDYISALCTKLGLTFANSENTFCNYDRIIENELFLSEDGSSLNYTFRDVLDQIAEVTGSIICINNEDELELRYITGEVPTPTRPSKNLLDTKGFQNGYINTSGSFISDNKTALLDYKIPVETEKTYCFSTNSNVDNMVISMFGSSDNFLRRQKVSNTKKLTQLMANDVSYVRFAINYNNSSTMTQEIIDNLEIMCEEGNVRTSPYEPYGSIEMGKNLLNVGAGYQIGKLDNTTGELIEDEYSCVFNQMIPVEKLTYYTFSADWEMENLDIYTYDENENFLSHFNQEAKEVRLYYRDTSNVSYIKLGFKDGYDIMSDQLVEEALLMLELGSTRTTPYEPYIEPQTDLDIIDEEYLKDINVKFGEKFGPVNSIVLSRAAESDSIYLQDNESVEENGLCEIKIKENQFMNFNDRDEYLPDLLDTLDGLEFYINDYSSTGITYLELCDLYNVKVDEQTYKCLMLNDTLEISQGISEDIFTDLPEKTETDYKKSDKTDNRINKAYIIVNKQTQEIEALTSKVDNLGDGYTKEEINQLIQTASEGITNNFINSGGNNILRNTGLWFEQDDEDNPYEFWTGNVLKAKEDKASNMSALLLQNSSLFQNQQVRNGTYTLSFKYKKLIQLADVNIQINNKTIELTEIEDTEIIENINVTSQFIDILFASDTDNSCIIYDLMINSGSEKAEYSQNQNETTTDTVNISKGITITSSDTNTTFKANSDGIRVYNSKDLSNPKTNFTDVGMETDKATINNEAEIVQVLWKNVGNNTWISRL